MTFIKVFANSVVHPLILTFQNTLAAGTFTIACTFDFEFILIYKKMVNK